jgi:hypothetical protein
MLNQVKLVWKIAVNIQSHYFTKKFLETFNTYLFPYIKFLVYCIDSFFAYWFCLPIYFHAFHMNTHIFTTSVPSGLWWINYSYYFLLFVLHSHVWFISVPMSLSYILWSRDSSVSIVIRFRAVFSGYVPGRYLSSLRHRVLTDSRDHPASYPTETGGSFPVVKQLKRETHHLLPSNAEVTNCGATAPLSH